MGEKKASMMKLQRRGDECTNDGGPVAVSIAAARTPQGLRDGE